MKKGIDVQFCNDCKHERHRMCHANATLHLDYVTGCSWYHSTKHCFDKRGDKPTCKEYKRVWWKFWATK